MRGPQLENVHRDRWVPELQVLAADVIGPHFSKQLFASRIAPGSGKYSVAELSEIGFELHEHTLHNFSENSCE